MLESPIELGSNVGREKGGTCIYARKRLGRRVFRPLTMEKEGGKGFLMREEPVGGKEKAAFQFR